MSAQASGAGRGILLCVAIVGFGALIVGGMKLAPRAESPAVPTTATALPPDRRLKFVSLDMQQRHLATMLPIVADIKRVDSDFVCVQDIASEDVVPLADALGMTKSFHMGLFAASQNLGGLHASFGNCVMAKGEIDAGAPIGGAERSFGVWGVAVVGDRKFRVASIHLADGDLQHTELNSLVSQWEEGDSLPIVVAGLFGSTSGTTDLVGRQTGWFDGLSPFVDLARSDGAAQRRILFSTGWAVVAGGMLSTEGGGPAPVWVVGTSVHAAMPATTRAVYPAGEEP